MKSPAGHTLLTFTRNFLTLPLIMAVTSLALAQSTGQQALTNDDVFKMVAAHMDESKIAWMIQTQPGHYSLATDDIDTLKRQEVPDAVIKAMEARNSAPTAQGQGTAATAAQSNSSPSTSAATAKKAGVTRIGIAMPRIVLGQTAQNPADAEALRGLLRTTLVARQRRLPRLLPCCLIR